MLIQVLSHGLVVQKATINRERLGTTWHGAVDTILCRALGGIGELQPHHGSSGGAGTSRGLTCVVRLLLRWRRMGESLLWLLRLR